MLPTIYTYIYCPYIYCPIYARAEYGLPVYPSEGCDEWLTFGMLPHEQSDD